MTEEMSPGPYLGGKVEALQHRFPNYFADAETDYKDARFVIAGAPYDATVSYRFGTRLGPDQIRQAAWNCERLNIRNGVNLRDVPAHDLGNLDLEGLSPEDMFDAVKAGAARIAGDGKFPIFLGGEHSITPPVVHALKERYPDLGVLQLDAHLDYRREYEGSINNHACAMRRISDAVSPDKMVGIGIRSVEEQEFEEANRDGFRFFTSFDVRRRGMRDVLSEALAHLDTEHVYITLDIDGLDPAYAPGTGTPEPFGLTPWDVLDAITRTAKHLVGFDVNEVSPPWDMGNTAALGAKIVREVLAEVWSAQE